MSKILVYKKYRPTEGRIFVSEKIADMFIKRVRKAGGAKLVKRTVGAILYKKRR